MTEKIKKVEENESLLERLDEIILKKTEQNSALRKLLEKLTNDEMLVSTNEDMNNLKEL